jgi:hypothetical protein
MNDEERAELAGEAVTARRKHVFKGLNMVFVRVDVDKLMEAGPFVEGGNFFEKAFKLEDMEEIKDA